MSSLYSRFYRLQEDPFSLTPDPKFFYSSAVYQEALMGVLYGVSQRRGIIVLTGEAGVGKTTVLYKVQERLGPSVRAVFLPSPHATFNEILEYLFQQLKIPLETNKLSMLDRLREFLSQEFNRGNNVVLFIDEAQSADLQELEDIRLLSNLQTAKTKLLQIVFAGQPEFQEKLDHPRLLALRQRIAVHCQLLPLGLEEVGDYIRVRMEVAGVKEPKFFSDEAIGIIARRSLGIPRLINLACDQALLTAYSLGQRQVDGVILREALADILPEPPQVVTPTTNALPKETPQNRLPPDLRGGATNKEKVTPKGGISSAFSSSHRLLKGKISSFGNFKTNSESFKAMLLSVVSFSTTRLLKSRASINKLARQAGKNWKRSWTKRLRLKRIAIMNIDFGAALKSIRSLKRQWNILERPPQSIFIGAMTVFIVVVSASIYFSFGRMFSKLNHGNSVDAHADRTMEGSIIAAAEELEMSVLRNLPTSLPAQKSEPEKRLGREGKVLALLEAVQTIGASPVVTPLAEITVQSGDTMTSLAAEKYGYVSLTVLDVLHIANPDVSNIHRLKIGQRLFFPDLYGPARVLAEEDGSFSYLLLSVPSKGEALYYSNVLGKEGRPASVAQIFIGSKKVYRVLLRGFLNQQAAMEEGVLWEREVVPDSYRAKIPSSLNSHNLEG